MSNDEFRKLLKETLEGPPESLSSSPVATLSLFLIHLTLIGLLYQLILPQKIEDR
jgi:hypothetical protein